MRKIAVMEDFLTKAHMEKLRAATERLGFAVDFYPKNVLPDEKAGEYEVIYGNCDPGLLKKATGLKWICCSFAGVDPFLSDDVYPNPDVLLSNSSGAYGTTIAEHIMMVTLMLLRRMPEFQGFVREHKWVRTLPMRSIYGSEITVLGTGDIGTEFARRVRAFHPASLTGVSRSGRANADFDAVHPVTELDQLLPETDLLFMSLPSVSDTVNILNAERMALLPKGAYVVNVGRGTAIDQDALIKALDSGHLAGAALDVVVPEPLPADHPLRKAKNLLLTPHVAGNMTLGYTCERNVQLFCENLENYAAGRPMHHLVDRRKGY